MDRNSIKELLKDVLGPNTPLVDHEKWVSFSCAFARWRHANGRDSRPSAGISINEDGVSIYNCQGCKSKYSVGNFLFELGHLSGVDYSEYADGIIQEEYLGGTLRPWGEKPNKVNEMPPPLDKHVYLDLYDTAYDHWYVQHRGITIDAAQHIGLRVDPADSKGDERILFPVYDHHEQFYGFTGRATDDAVYPPIRDYHGLPKRFLLLGSHLLRPDDPYVIAVEGLFDYAMLISYGQPTVAYMGSLPTDDQIRAFIDIGKPVYYFRDNDKAGLDSQELLKGTELCAHLPVMQVKYPRKYVVGRDGVRRLAKDPDEFTADEIAEMVAGARLL